MLVGGPPSSGGHLLFRDSHRLVFFALENTGRDARTVQGLEASTSATAEPGKVSAVAM